MFQIDRAIKIWNDELPIGSTVDYMELVKISEFKISKEVSMRFLKLLFECKKSNVDDFYRGRRIYKKIENVTRKEIGLKDKKIPKSKHYIRMKELKRKRKKIFEDGIAISKAREFLVELQDFELKVIDHINDLKTLLKGE